jgi:hypothetical protein
MFLAQEKLADVLYADMDALGDDASVDPLVLMMIPNEF